MSDSDVLIKLREEEWSLLRHYEGQRARVTNTVAAIMAVSVGSLVQNGINRSSLPIGVLLIILGIYGIFAVAKLYERIHLANDLALRYTQSPDKLHPKIGIEKLRREVRTVHKAEFPLTSKLRMNALWITLHSVIVLSGIALTIWILVQP